MTETVQAEIVTEETLIEMASDFQRESALANVVILLNLFNKHIHTNEFIKGDMHLKIRADDAREHFTAI